ncbi:hypothetical protein ABDK09_20945 [Vibrio sp. CDRSL-10 TSBA]
MSQVNGLSACYDAIERLKEGKPINEKFIGITHNKITASVVSQEAGFDSGYLKRSRPSHQAIIAMIDAIKANQDNNSLSKAEVKRRHNQKIEKMNSETSYDETTSRGVSCA